ncbi:MAG TPA: hypothetical protein VFT72_12510 [Opitutaceae bacterium]|nr:hypothetical protein [Opitutaceae bacterium]
MQNAISLNTLNFQLSETHQAEVTDKFRRVLGGAGAFIRLRVTLEGKYPSNTAVYYNARAVMETRSQELYITTRSEFLYNAIDELVAKIGATLARSS